jgi:hypothetical protein
MISITSITGSKHYIPGETKEIEGLRRKAILCGLTVLADISCELCPHDDIANKIKTEIIDNLDINDVKLHLYSVFTHFRSKLEA